MKILLLVCIFWTTLFFYPSDGAAVTRKLGNCPRNGYKRAVFHCKKRCIIKWAIVRFYRGGNIDIVGREGRRVFTPLRCGRKCFCRGFTRRPRFEKCFKKKGHNIRKGIVSFVMKCKKFTRNVRLSVYGNIRPRKTKRTTIPKVRKRGIGNMHLYERKIFKVGCKGKCDLKNLSARFKGDVDLYASEILRNLANCTDSKCICMGQSLFENRENCDMKKTVSSNSFYIMVEAKKTSHQVNLTHTTGNFFSINPISTSEFPEVLAWEIGDLAMDEVKYFRVKCKGTCDLNFPYVAHNEGTLLEIFMSNGIVRREVSACGSWSKCICQGVNSRGSATSCYPKHKISSDSFYIMLRPIRDSYNVTLNYRLGNFLSLNQSLPDCHCNDPALNWDGNCDIETGLCSCKSGYKHDPHDSSCKLIGGG